MRIKKFLTVGISALVAVSMAFSLAACTTTSGTSTSTSSGTTSTGTTDSSATSDSTATSTKETITIWCSETEGVADQMQSQLDSYVATYEANTGTSFGYTFNIVGKSEANAASDMITDVSAGADIYCFAQDQLYRLVEAGALATVSSSYSSYVANNNDAGSVDAATVGDTLYAYPLTADNGYFMYYDKSVISEDDIANQTDLIAACAAAGKKIGFQLSEDGGWYNASYFFATGCISDWTFNDDGSVKEYKDTFNSDEGIIAVKGMAELINSGSWVNVSAASNLDADGACAVVVSGTWDYTTAIDAIGEENLGCAKLWSFTVDGTDYQLGSFSGYKLMGVKPQTDSTKQAMCQALAYYLTNETCQEERLTTFGWGPSNTTVQQSEAIASNPALVALSAQNEYSTPQGNYPDAWWTAAATMGASISALQTVSPTDEQCQAILTTYANTLTSIANPAFDGWVLTGNLELASWDTMCEDYELTYEMNTYADKTTDDPYLGIWTITATVVDSGDGTGYVAFCHYGSWDGQTGGDYLDTANSVSTAIASGTSITLLPGTYTFTIDTTSGTPVITVVAA